MRSDTKEKKECKKKYNKIQWKKDEKKYKHKRDIKWRAETDRETNKWRDRKFKIVISFVSIEGSDNQVGWIHTWHPPTIEPINLITP